MSRDAPYHQHLSGVSTQNHSQAFVGSARDVYFAVSHNTKDASEQACRNALFLTDPHVDRERLVSAKGVRVAGTCEWITHDASYRTWLNSNSDGDGDSDSNTRLLWISGGPGKGKTMIAEDEKRSTAVSALRGLIHQILVKRPQLVKHALPHFETPERTQQTVSSLETLWLIFSELIADANLGTIFCVLDGLDECEDSTLRVLLPRIVRFLTSESSSSTKGRFKLAIVSRDMPSLQGYTTRVRLDPDNDEKVASDIELFVSARVQDLSRIKGLDKEFQAYIQTALLQRAEGTFLWVGFAVDKLSQQQTRSQILEALEDLPSGLPAIYSRMLRRIPARQRKMSLTILRWVTIAARPLELRELAAAIGIQDTPQMTMEQAVCDAITICGPLLKVQKQEISLIHQSARDYLLHIERDGDAVLEAFRLNFESSHLELARKCLDCIAQSYLQYKDMDLNAKLDLQVSPLLRYALLYWPEHAKSCSALAAELFDPSMLFFKKESPLRDFWLEIYAKMTLFRYRPLPVLHMACVLEIIPWVAAAGAEKSWRLGSYKCVNERDNDGKTALHLVASRGNEAVVRLLLDKGADVNAKDNDETTVLHSVASSGTENTAVVQLLVDRGADVKAKGNDGTTVLHSVASSGTENAAVVQLLVDRGADVKAKDNKGKTALHCAASSLGEKEAVVQLLVDKGADVKAKENKGRTALHCAALSLGEKEAVVQLLVDRGADVEAKDNKGMTALHLAALGGKEAVVRLLLDRGVDIESKDKDGNTALYWAAEREGEAMVQLLIYKGADVKAKNGDGKTALHWAAWVGKEVVVRLLLDRGADVKAKDTNGMTALHFAASSRILNTAVVQLLVDHGADVGAKDTNGMTALHWAALLTRKEVVVKLLIDLGADVGAKDAKGMTALHLAAGEGKEAVVRLLVHLGADVKAKDTNRMTALHCVALWTRNEAMVQLLVDLGADIGAKDTNGMTALHLAAGEGKEILVRLLVGLGADIEAKDNNRMTALHLAAWEGKEVLVQLLVDLGADVHGEGKMALYLAAIRRNTVVVRLLVYLIADAEAKDNNEKAVLRWAAERVRNEVIVWLLVGPAMDDEVKDIIGRMYERFGR